MGSTGDEGDNWLVGMVSRAEEVWIELPLHLLSNFFLFFAGKIIYYTL